MISIFYELDERQQETELVLNGAPTMFSRLFMLATVGMHRPATMQSSPLLRSAQRALRRTSIVQMPEGPEVTVHAEQLNRMCSGHRLCAARILSGRYVGDGEVPGRSAPPAGWNVLLNALPATIASVHSHGKFLWWQLTGVRQQQLTLWSTLGMTGAWSTVPSAHARVVMTLEHGGEIWRLFYNDQRNFGVLTVGTEPAALEDKLASLGPSWLASGGLGLEEFLAVVHKQTARPRGARVAVAKFLMDQSKTAGIGNYILSETLYLARVHPWALCADLDDDAWAEVHAAANDVIQRSYTAQAQLASAAARTAAEPTEAAEDPCQRQGDRTTPTPVRRLAPTRGTTFAFRLYVYRQMRSEDGHAVLRGDGPHGRSIFWVPERQTRGLSAPS